MSTIELVLAAVVAISVAWALAKTRRVRELRAELRADRSDAPFRVFVESAAMVPWEFDLLTQRFTYVGAQAEALFGYSRQQWLEAGFWARHIDDADRADVVKARGAATQRLENHILDYRMRTADARVVWVKDIITVVASDGVPTKLRGFLVDITQQKTVEFELAQNKARLEQIYRSAPDGILLVDTSVERIREANPGAAKMLEYTVEDLVDLPLRTLHPNDMAAVRGFATSVLGDGSVRAGRMNCRTRSGRVLPVEISASRIDDLQSSSLLLMFIRDISERERVEKAQRLLEGRVRDAQKYESLAVLAGGIAHDFNNLLVGVLSNAEMARECVTDPRPRQMIDEIDRAATRAADLTHQLLAYAGRARVIPQKLDLGRLVREMGSLLESAIVTGVELRYETESDAWIEGDPTQIRQVLMNLIVNASDSMADRGGDVVVRVGRVESYAPDARTVEFSPSLQGGPAVFVEVADVGHGMSAKVQSRMFDPFFSTKSYGRGLGLSAALGIVRAHEGAVRVESALTLGSRVTVTLPAATAPAGAAEPAPARQPAPRAVRGTVLVADDEGAVRTAAVRLLAGAGYDVITASDGNAAVAAYRAQRSDIHVALLDVTMPGRGGVDVLGEIRDRDPTLPVVLMSGYDGRELRASDTAVDDPNVHFLHKPFRNADLLEVLALALVGAIHESTE